jgi:hypothetical protein
VNRFALAAVTLLALTGCAEATATNEAPSAWEIKAANPRFAEAAQRALASAPQPEPGWRVGVIMAETTDPQWAVSVLTQDGPVYVTYDPWSYDCEAEGEGIAFDVFPLLLDPGDLITWAGDGRVKHRVCAEDMRVLRKGAA